MRLIKDISKKFGAQCIVAGVDYKVSKENQEIEVWSECGKILTKINFYDHIENITKLGVGEIFLNSIDNDGLMKGYDLKISKIVSEKFEVYL